MKMFNKILMASEDENNLLKTGVFYADDAEAACEDGALVSILGLVSHDLYDNMKDFNARKITAFDSTAPICGVVDYVGVSQADVMGVTYRIGDKILGLAPQAGERIRVRMFHEGDEFFLGNENFSGTPAVGKFAIPENGKTTWKIADAIATSGLCVEIEDSKDLIMGQVNEGTKAYRCRVVRM